MTLKRTNILVSVGQASKSPGYYVDWMAELISDWLSRKVIHMTLRVFENHQNICLLIYFEKCTVKTTHVLLLCTKISLFLILFPSPTTSFWPLKFKVHVFEAPLKVSWRYEFLKLKDHFNNKGVGAMDELHGELGNVHLHVLTMKKEDYIMMLISTYGTNEQVGEDKSRTIGG